MKDSPLGTIAVRGPKEIRDRLAIIKAEHGRQHTVAEIAARLILCADKADIERALSDPKAAA